MLTSAAKQALLNKAIDNATLCQWCQLPPAKWGIRDPKEPCNGKYCRGAKDKFLSELEGK